MSFCDNDVAANCDECYELSAGDCLPITINTNLTASTDYWLICTDKFGNRYDAAVTSTSGGDFNIDPGDFPSELFNQFAGKFEFVVSVSAVDVEPVTMVIGSTSYNCIIVQWSVTCCNNTYVPPTFCETYLDGLTDEQKACICAAISEVCPDGCDDATVENSDGSFTHDIPPGDTYVLPDTTYNFLINNVLQNTETVPALVAQDFEINFV